MRLKKAFEITKEFEGCKLTAYQCSAYVWTIGWGETYQVKEGDTITQTEADAMLEKRIFELEKRILELVKVKLSENEICALISFVYNVGIGNFRNSKLLQRLNLGLRAQAGREFLKWNRAGGKELEGLNRRRRAERVLFLTKDGI